MSGSWDVRPFEATDTNIVALVKVQRSPLIVYRPRLEALRKL